MGEQKRKSSTGIVAFGFGVPSTLRSNRIIAKIATDRAQTLKAPIFTQADVPVDDENIEVIYANEEPGNPPPTLRIAREAVRWAQKNQFTELWFAAALPHLPRAWGDLKYAAKEAGWPIGINGCAEILDYTDRDWFCPESEQKHTQSRKNWRLREFILMHMPFWLYKRVAS